MQVPERQLSKTTNIVSTDVHVDIPISGHKPLNSDSAEMPETKVEMVEDHISTVDEIACAKEGAGEEVQRCDTTAEVW